MNSSQPRWYFAGESLPTYTGADQWGPTPQPTPREYMRRRRAAKACTHKSRLGNRWLPQTTCADCLRFAEGRDAQRAKESPGTSQGFSTRWVKSSDPLDAPILSQSTNQAKRWSRYASESCKVRVQKITIAFNHWVRPTRSLAGWRCNRAQGNRGWGRAGRLSCAHKSNQWRAVCGRALRECFTGSRASVVSWVRRFGSQEGRNRPYLSVLLTIPRPRTPA